MGSRLKVRAFGSAAMDAGLIAVMLAALIMGWPGLAKATSDSGDPVAMYEQAAHQGDAVAQYQLGLHYQLGWGVREDDIEADKWFSRAAAAGSATGQQALDDLRTKVVPTNLPLTAEQNDEDVPPYDLKLLPDGRSLIIAGGIRFGLARDIETALGNNPGIRTIVLESPGGRIKEADAVLELIRKRGLDTYASRDCLSACTLIFVAGKHRGLSYLARLGFHSDAITVPMPGKGLLLWFLNRATVELYTGVGVDRAFMQRAIATPPESMWYPTKAELVDAHVLTAEADGPDLGMPAITDEARHGRSLEAVH